MRPSCDLRRFDKAMLLAKVEALAHKVDERKPGYRDNLLRSYKVRKLEMLSSCELSGLIDVLKEDLQSTEGDP
jgi:GTP cyclohydrolase II